MEAAGQKIGLVADAVTEVIRLEENAIEAANRIAIEREPVEMF